MTRVAFGELQGEKVALSSLSGSPLDGEPGRIDLLLLSRLDCGVRCVEIPPVPERELSALIRYRIRSVYPGSLGDALVDQIVQKRDRVRVAFVVISDPRTLERFRRAAPRASFSLLSAALLRSPSLRPEGSVVCWLPGYLEVMKFEAGVLLESALVKRSRAPSDMQRIFKLLQGHATSKVLFLARGEDLSRLTRQAASLAPDGMRIEARALESIELARRGTPVFFRPRRQPRAPRPAVVRGALGLAIVALSLGVLLKHVRFREVELSRLRTAVLGSQAQGQRRADLERRFSSTESRVASLLRDRPLDVFRFFADLREELGPDVRVQDLVLQNGVFQLQAVGPDPLSLMQRFVSDPRFHDLRLLQTIPLAGSPREQFIVTGRYAR